MCFTFKSQTVVETNLIHQFNDFLNLIFGGLLTFRPTVRRAMDAIASHFFSTMKTFQKLLVCVLNVLSSHTWWCNISNAFFPPNIYWIQASISIRRWKKIAFDQSNRVGFMALLLIKQKCIEPSTNMKQVSTLCFLFTWNQQVNFSYSPNMFWSFVLATLMSRIDDSVCWLLVTTVYYWNFPLHAIWSYNERWDFPRAGSSLFLPRFSGLTFLRFLGLFFIFSEIFTSGVLYFLFCALISYIFSSIIHFTGDLIF